MSPTSEEHAPVVTLAALYGAGGSAVGPRVAEQLGVPFLDRSLPGAAGASSQAVADVDEEPRTRVERLTAGLGRLSTVTGGVGGSHERLDADEGDVRRRFEAFLAEASRSGGVAVGRGGMVILRSVPWALHVHLSGPKASRVAQGMALEGVDRATAEAHQRAEDRARASYVQRIYGVDGSDPALYHLVLDATALDLDACVELIVAAARSRARHPHPSPPM